MSKQGPSMGQMRSLVLVGSLEDLVLVGSLEDLKGRFTATQYITKTTPAITNHAKNTTQPGSRFLSELIQTGYSSFLGLPTIPSCFYYLSRPEWTGQNQIRHTGKNIGGWRRWQTS